MFLLRKIRAFRKIQRNFQFSTHLNSFAVESNMTYVLKNIGQVLSCAEETALTVYQNFPSIRSVYALSGITENIKLLTDNGVSKELISDNPFLLCLQIDVLQRKLETMKQMQPRHIDDYIPLLEMTEPILREVAEKTATERGVIPEKSRIYYLSKELQIAPVTVSKYCSKCKLIFFASFTGIARKLNILLDYNVDGKQILQSLYIFQCADRVFISRLEELSSNGLHDFKLWYLKCTDEKFHKVLASKAKVAKELPTELAHKFNKRKLENLNILKALNAMLSCDDKISAQIYYNFINNIKQLPLAKENIEFLTNNEVSLEFIRSNAVVLTLPNAQINDNIKLIKEMDPKSIEDFLPLVEVDTSTLEVFARNIYERRSELLGVHPIYIFSKKLNISPIIVSQYFAKHSKLFFVMFISLQKKLDLLISYNVQPMSILKSPDTFKMSFETLESTLNNLKSQGIENILSWMLVCDTSRMNAVFARRVEEKKLVGESANIVDYVAKRLNWNDADRYRALKYYPPLAKCSVIKVKAHLDYLLNETHFTVEDINSNVSVFRTNLDELKLRMNELTSIGLIPQKLYSICVDRRRYLEMVGKFCKKKKCPATLETFKLIERRIKNLYCTSSDRIV